MKFLLFWVGLFLLFRSIISIKRTQFEYSAKYLTCKTFMKGIVRSLRMNSDSLDTVSRTVGHFNAIKHIFICADQSKPKCCNYEVELKFNP